MREKEREEKEGKRENARSASKRENRRLIFFPQSNPRLARAGLVALRCLLFPAASETSRSALWSGGEHAWTRLTRKKRRGQKQASGPTRAIEYFFPFRPQQQTFFSCLSYISTTTKNKTSAPPPRPSSRPSSPTLTPGPASTPSSSTPRTRSPSSSRSRFWRTSSSGGGARCRTSSGPACATLSAT